jgi:hypothetical protein
MPLSSDDRRPKELLLACLIACVWLIVNTLPLVGLPHLPDDAPGFDAHIYLTMAEHPQIFTMPPYAYRIGTPLLAHFLPFRLELSFLVITAFGLFMLLILTYSFLRQLGFSWGLAIVGMSFVAGAPEIQALLDNHFLVEPMALAFVALLFIGIERRLSAGPMALLLLVASLFKESALYVVPVLYLREAGGWRIDRQAIARVVLVCIPAVVAGLILRFGWGGEFSGFPYRAPWSVPRLAWFGEMGLYREIWQHLFRYLAFLAIANAFTKRWRGFASRYSPYFALVIAQLLVPLNYERLLFYSYPFIVPLALAEFQRIKDELPKWYPLLCTLLVFCYLFAPSELVPPLLLVIMARLLMERRNGEGGGS